MIIFWTLKNSNFQFPDLVFFEILIKNKTTFNCEWFSLLFFIFFKPAQFSNSIISIPLFLFKNFRKLAQTVFNWNFSFFEYFQSKKYKFKFQKFLKFLNSVINFSKTIRKLPDPRNEICQHKGHLFLHAK